MSSGSETDESDELFDSFGSEDDTPGSEALTEGSPCRHRGFSKLQDAEAAGAQLLLAPSIWKRTPGQRVHAWDMEELAFHKVTLAAVVCSAVVVNVPGAISKPGHSQFVPRLRWTLIDTGGRQYGHFSRAGLEEFAPLAADSEEQTLALWDYRDGSPGVERNARALGTSEGAKLVGWVRSTKVRGVLLHGRRVQNRGACVGVRHTLLLAAA